MNSELNLKIKSVITKFIRSPIYQKDWPFVRHIPMQVERNPVI